MTVFVKKMTKYLFGALIGILILLIIVSFYREIFMVEKYKNIPILLKTSKINEKDNLLIDYKIELSNIEEKIISINKRIDDLCIFGGIIVTLLLAINVSVYVNAESVVNKFLKENLRSIQ